MSCSYIPGNCCTEIMVDTVNFKEHLCITLYKDYLLVKRHRLLPYILHVIKTISRRPVVTTFWWSLYAGFHMFYQVRVMVYVRACTCRNLVESSFIILRTVQ